MPRLINNWAVIGVIPSLRAKMLLRAGAGDFTCHNFCEFSGNVFIDIKIIIDTVMFGNAGQK
jgi:hypothetical protein